MKLIEAKTITLKVVAVADYDFEKEIKFLLNIKIIVDIDHFIDFVKSIKGYKNNLYQYINYLLDYDYENVYMLKKNINFLEKYGFNKEIKGKKFGNINKIYLAKNKEYLYLKQIIDRILKEILNEND